MKGLAIGLALSLGLATTAGPIRAQAQDAEAHVGAAARSEAGDRFDRGLRLINAGDNAGALVEFRRAYALVPNVVVLYNMGLLYAQMGRSVEATDALGRVLTSPGTLSPERLERARRVRDEQAARVAEVDVRANVEGARIEVDGVEAGKTQAAAPLRVPSGTHVVGLVAPGFAPQRKEIALAGGEKQSLVFELVALQGRLARVVVKTHLPGADLYADDQRIGTTPLAASVTLAPGRHRLELRRAGYATASTEVTLADGAVGEVTLEAAEDPSALAVSGGSLALDVSESLPVVTVDGRARGVYQAPLRVLPGPHHLLVERGDFLPFEREVTVESLRTTAIRVALEPTPEFRTRFTSRSQTQRTWGIVSMVGGAVLAAGGVGLGVYDAGKRSDGTAARDTLLRGNTQGSGLPCDTGQEATLRQQMCLGPIASATAEINDANTRDYIAWSAVGVGAALTVLGAVLFVTADNPRKYDEPKSAPDTAGAGRWAPSFWTTRAGGGLSVAGTF